MERTSALRCLPNTGLATAVMAASGTAPIARVIAGRAGEVGGMKQLLLEMSTELRRFALARQCDPAEVDDLLQDLYIKLDQGRTGPVANPRAYLFQMTNNLILDRRRARRRQARRDDDWARSSFGQDLAEAPAASPERVAIDRHLLAHVEAAIAAMPDRTADILRRFRIEEHSQKRIALDLDISLSAVEKHLQRAYRVLLALREEFEQDPGQEANSQ